MAKADDVKALGNKLQEIRDRLMASPTGSDLNAIQLQTQALQRWAQLALIADDPGQHHDHSMATDHNDHDHSIVFSRE